MTGAPALWRIERAGPQHPSALPLIVNVPHAGTYLPPSIAAALSPAGVAVPDTDWQVDKLCGFVPAMGATLMVATHSRFVVDLNRDPSGDALYPGMSNTGICPVASFADAPLYQPGRVPDQAEIAARIDRYWRPYHRQLAAEIARIKAQHGVCILLDAHSIAGEVPRLFAGRLPDLNLGTADGRSCAPPLAHAAFAVLSHADGFTAVHNGRFKGGYITRHYGAPADDVHALQLEMAQRCYMDESQPWHYDGSRAGALTAVLKTLVEQLLAGCAALGAETKKQDHC